MVKKIALIKNNKVVNVVLAGKGWKAPKGHVLLDVEKAKIGQDYDPETGTLIEPEAPQPTYDKLRRDRMLARYSKTDQLDIILKAFNQRRLNGEDMPQEMDDLLGFWLQGKQDIPKPEGGGDA